MTRARMVRRAFRLANECFKAMANIGCSATDDQKRIAICFLPRQRARLEKCKGCEYWKG